MSPRDRCILANEHEDMQDPTAKRVDTPQKNSSENFSIAFAFFSGNIPLNINNSHELEYFFNVSFQYFKRIFLLQWLEVIFTINVQCCVRQQ